MTLIPRPAGLTHAGAMTDEAISAILKAVGYHQPILYTANGAIDPHTQQRALLNKASALSMTLAAPTAGPADQGGDDYTEIEIISLTNAAHQVTITNLKSGASSASTKITFAAFAGCSAKFMAYQGTWIPLGGSNGGTFS